MSFLDYPAIIQTDSGGYQVLRYGRIEAGLEEIVKIQEIPNVDIATTLDEPTGANVDEARAVETVKNTLRNSDLSLRARTRDDILWVGPVQGGLHDEAPRSHLLRCDRRRR